MINSSSTTPNHFIPSSNGLNTSVSDNAKCKQTKFDTYALIPKLTLNSKAWFEGYVICLTKG